MLLLAQYCQEVSGCGLSVVASKAEDEAKAFSDFSGLQTASDVNCKLVLMVLWP